MRGDAQFRQALLENCVIAERRQHQRVKCVLQPIEGDDTLEGNEDDLDINEGDDGTGGGSASQGGGN